MAQQRITNRFDGSVRITNRFDGSVLWEGEADSVKDATHKALASRANLSHANLSRADLSGADLSDADLSGADLYGANLSGANLSGATLYGADLSGADLSGATLYGANLSRANLCRATGVQPHVCTPLLMLLDQPGAIRAYKLVTACGVGPFNGNITYSVGNSYEVSNANTDVNEHCGAGIHLATLDWCLRAWRQGYRILIAEFTAADIAAIPTATDGKFRVHRCRIVAEKEIGALVPQKKAQVA